MADRRALAKARFLHLIAQLSEEHGSERQACKHAKVDPSYPGKLRDSASRFVGLEQLAKTTAALRLRSEFFEDESLGDTPDYHQFVGAGSASHVDRDDDTLRAVRDMVADILSPEERREYEEHDADWGRELAFRDIRALGLDNIRPQLIYSLWRERRAQRRGKDVEGQVLEPKVRPGRVRLEE